MVSLLFPLTLEINSSQSSQSDRFKRNTFHSHLCSKSTDASYPLRICEITSRDLHNQASLSVSLPLAQFPCLLVSLLFPKITIYALALMNTVFLCLEFFSCRYLYFIISPSLFFCSSIMCTMEPILFVATP